MLAYRSPCVLLCVGLVTGKTCMYMHACRYRPYGMLHGERVFNEIPKRDKRSSDKAIKT